MMANEVTWQRKIIKRLCDEGGYGKKWATAYAVGVPDLILVTGALGLLVAEVKLEKNWNKNTDRTLGITSKQKKELNDIRDAGGSACVLLIVQQSPTQSYLNAFAPPGRRGVLTLSRDKALSGAYVWGERGLLSHYLFNLEGVLR